ncbi:ABC transporter substrate-binding protein [Variovorax sp. OV329]|uniref:ABC transporter substrate-binding protein n=1 Tax=Variovorax sp. OV329 TaxID=1882825 RepID=UPI0008E09D96|nr:ABC transporter substrate-binding protein [Variovorax sp. OV329]SFM10706.1 putative ABC transport system substrate-binding protein [Variovorax sp. OV329]
MLKRTLLVGTLCCGAEFVRAQSDPQQSRKVHRIGYISAAADLEHFQEAMQKLGYIEGINTVFVVRLARGRLNLLPSMATDILRLQVEVIVAASPPAIQAAKNATSTIPIVMAVTSVDPVRSGFVTSMARPGGNITGVAMISDVIAGKRLELLSEVLSRSKPIALLAQVGHTAGPGQIEAAKMAARSLGRELLVFEVRDARDYESAISQASVESAGLFVLSNPTFFDDRVAIATLASRNGLATLCEWREMAAAGCLMAYGPSVEALHHRVATFVDRILRGAQAGDLPVEMPMKFDLTINLTTAKALGINIEKSLLRRAQLLH